MDDVLRSTVDLMTDSQIDFICKESGLAPDELRDAPEEKLDEIYDLLCDIEIEETDESGEGLSERGEIAEGLVTLMGNAIAESEGYLDEDEGN